MKNTKKEFGKIYDQYIEKIYRFIFLKVNSKEIAEDLTSETFSKVWTVFRNQNPKIENVGAFLYQTARNLIVDHYREKNKISIISTESSFPIADPREDLQKKVVNDTDLEIVKKTLKKLEEDAQNAIIWYYIDDLPIQEVAELLGKTANATRVLISRAIKTLKKYLQGEV